GAEEDEIAAELARAWLMDYVWREVTDKSWTWGVQQGYDENEFENEDEARALYLIDWLSDKGYDEELLASDSVYARRAALREWLRDKGYDPDFLLAFEGQRRARDIGVSARAAIRLVCLREWLQTMQDRLEHIADGRSAPSLENLDVAALKDEEIDSYALAVSREMQLPMP